MSGSVTKARAMTRAPGGVVIRLSKLAIVCIAASVFAEIPIGARAQSTSPGGRSLSNATAKPVPATAAQRVTAADEEIIARVGNIDLKAESLRTFVGSLGARDQAALAHDPALLSQMVRSLLANQLVLKEALAKHWDQKPEIAEQLQRAREITIVDSYLKSISQPPVDFPDETTVRNAYEANQTAFLVPRQFLLAQIYVALPNDADKAAIDKGSRRVADIQMKLKQTDANFESIARANSDSKEGAERGGEIGWVLETQLRPEIKALVIGLAKDAVAAPLKLDDGWHIIKLIDTKPAYTRPLSEVKGDLVQRLRDERANSSRREYLTELLKQNPPAINELALAKVLADSTQTSPR